MIPAVIERLRQHLREFGWRGFHLRILAGLSIYREMPLYEIELTPNMARIESSLPVEYSVLTEHELEDFAAETGESLESVKREWNLGARCFVARHQNRIVARVWAAERPYFLTYLHRMLELQPDEIYLLDGFTHQAFRGRNLIGALITHVLETYRRQGRRRACAIIFQYNLASIRATQKTGFRLHSVLGYWGLVFWRIPFERHS